MAVKRALFLDRDGVINYNYGYVYRKENFDFIEGIFDVCRSAKALGYELIVITNQAGIGRGYYTEEDFEKLTEWMCDHFKKEDAPITDVFYCPYHPVHGLGGYRKDSFDRKPNPGMLLRAAEKHCLSMVDSIMLGDKQSDISAAKSAGVGITCLYELDENKNSKLADYQINRLIDVIPIIDLQLNLSSSL